MPLYEFTHCCDSALTPRRRILQAASSSKSTTRGTKNVSIRISWGICKRRDGEGCGLYFWVKSVSHFRLQSDFRRSEDYNWAYRGSAWVGPRAVSEDPRTAGAAHPGASGREHHGRQGTGRGVPPSGGDVFLENLTDEEAAKHPPLVREHDGVVARYWREAGRVRCSEVEAKVEFDCSPVAGRAPKRLVRGQGIGGAVRRGPLDPNLLRGDFCRTDIGLHPRPLLCPRLRDRWTKANRIRGWTGSRSN